MQFNEAQALHICFKGIASKAKINIFGFKIAKINPSNPSLDPTSKITLFKLYMVFKTFNNVWDMYLAVY